MQQRAVANGFASLRFMKQPIHQDGRTQKTCLTVFFRCFVRSFFGLGSFEALIDSWSKQKSAIGYHKISGIRKGLETVQTGTIVRAIWVGSTACAVNRSCSVRHCASLLQVFQIPALNLHWLQSLTWWEALCHLTETTHTCCRQKQHWGVKKCMAVLHMNHDEFPTLSGVHLLWSLVEEQGPRRPWIQDYNLMCSALQVDTRKMINHW